jgi:hypothetical protein
MLEVSIDALPGYSPTTPMWYRFGKSGHVPGTLAMTFRATTNRWDAHMPFKNMLAKTWLSEILETKPEVALRNA